MTIALIAIYLIVGFSIAEHGLMKACRRFAVPTGRLRWGLIAGGLLRMITWPAILLFQFGFPSIIKRLIRYAEKLIGRGRALEPAALPLTFNVAPSMEISTEERIRTVANMLAENRQRSMSGGNYLFNSEAILAVLVFPDWLLSSQIGPILSMLPQRKETSEIWGNLKSDIERMFPGQFDWENEIDRSRK